MTHKYLTLAPIFHMSHQGFNYVFVAFVTTYDAVVTYEHFGSLRCWCSRRVAVCEWVCFLMCVPRV